MLRQFHSLPGLIVALFVIVLSITGAILSLNPAIERAGTVVPATGQISVAELAGNLGLLLSGLTGSYLSATTFGLVPEGMEAEPEFPLEVTGGPPAAIDTLPALKATDLNDLRELVYPYPDDPTDMYSLGTDQGAGYIDQASGEWLSYQPHNATRKLYEFIHRLHTGEGLWWLGLILGLAALTVPLMAVTGAMIWWKRPPVEAEARRQQRGERRGQRDPRRQRRQHDLGLRQDPAR